MRKPYAAKCGIVSALLPSMHGACMEQAVSDTLMTMVGRRLGDLSDLPDALRRQLSTGKLDDLEEKIVHTLRERYDGIASLDEILVGLYRDFGYIAEDRRVLSNKIYRMAKAGHIERVAKRKGVVKLKA